MNDTELLQAAIERCQHWMPQVAGREKLLWETMNVALDMSISLYHTSDMLCGIICRQLWEWGYGYGTHDDTALTVEELLAVTLWWFSGDMPRRHAKTWTGPTLLDCYLDALVWARKRKEDT